MRCHVEQAGRRRRELLAAATPGGGGIVASVVILDERRPPPGAPGQQQLCRMCLGSGQTSRVVVDAHAVVAAQRAETSLASECGVCGCDGEFALSAACSRHFFCRDCIRGSLHAIVETGQFPAHCPVCRVEHQEQLDNRRTSGAAKGKATAHEKPARQGKGKQKATGGAGLAAARALKEERPTTPRTLASKLDDLRLQLALKPATLPQMAEEVASKLGLSEELSEKSLADRIDACYRAVHGDDAQAPAAAVEEKGDAADAEDAAADGGARAVADAPDAPSLQSPIEVESLSWLQSRGVISRDLLFRFCKAAHSADPAAHASMPKFSACPAGCGRWLLEEHASYNAHAVKLGEFFSVGDKMALRLGRCDCGALVCSRCYTVVPPAEGDKRRLHLCKTATAEADPATLELMKRIGRKCPACGNFVQKVAGCNLMMCGTNAHGKVQDALRNGGCAFIFDWNSLKACDDGHGYTNAEGKWVKGKGPVTERQVVKDRK